MLLMFAPSSKCVDDCYSHFSHSYNYGYRKRVKFQLELFSFPTGGSLSKVSVSLQRERSGKYT